MLRSIQAFLSGAVTCLTCGVLGLAIGWFGSQDLRRAAMLAESSRTAEARIIDWSVETRTSAVSFGESFDVQYELVLDGHPYYAREATDATDWVSIERSVWESSQATGTLTVRYVPEDPRVNEPVAATRHGVVEGLAGLAGGGFCCLLSLAMPAGLIFWLVRRGPS